MKNFIKNLSLYHVLLSVILAISPFTLQAASSAESSSAASSSASSAYGSASSTPRAIPSVAEVFGGLSEQEIADQVQMGQQFLEDLKANGSPEDLEAFMRMLSDTVNSMSDEDFKDIEAISEMVRPLISMPEEPIMPITSESNAEAQPKDIVKPESSATEAFKQLILSITQRINDIFQKINSSKECAEEVDTKWKNKSTFSNMKRQIYQLRTDRLAEKLGKKDISGDEKDLVETLKKYLADLTEHNDKLIIEDNFGLPSSYALEKKHVKQTISFLDMSDEYIDKLMPKLEKFLRKYDPEALQLAKEAEETTKKASKSAIDATVRRPSADARSLPTTTPSGSKSSIPTGSGYQNYGGGYDDYGQAYPGGAYSPEETKGGSKSKSEAATPKAKEGTSTAKTVEATKDKDKKYTSLLDDLEDHLKDDYPTSHENKFVAFLQTDLVDAYPSDKSKFVNYATDMIDRLKKDFTKEFEPVDSVLSDMEDNLHKMSTDELKKLQSAKALTSLEARLKHYRSAFESALPALDKKYQQNDPDPKNKDQKYENAHNDFIKTLTSEVGDKIESLFGAVNRVKRKAKRNANRKQTDSEKS